MIQKYMITVDLDKPLAKFGDNHVLIYDKNSNTYSVATEEGFLAPQNKKIAELAEKFEKLKKATNTVLQETVKIQNEFVDRMTKRQNVFMEDVKYKNNKDRKEMDEKYQEFLATYKKTNSKMIEMIEELVIGGAKDE